LVGKAKKATGTPDAKEERERERERSLEGAMTVTYESIS
jgi:hypothetical protein